MNDWLLFLNVNKYKSVRIFYMYFLWCLEKEVMCTVKRWLVSQIEMT